MEKNVKWELWRYWGENRLTGEMLNAPTMKQCAKWVSSVTREWSNETHKEGLGIVWDEVTKQRFVTYDGKRWYKD
nr:MAG TPA: hypothetical protein [Caudoviricetes sp.]